MSCQNSVKIEKFCTITLAVDSPPIKWTLIRVTELNFGRFADQPPVQSHFLSVHHQRNSNPIFQRISDLYGTEISSLSTSGEGQVRRHSLLSRVRLCCRLDQHRLSAAPLELCTHILHPLIKPDLVPIHLQAVEQLHVL